MLTAALVAVLLFPQATEGKPKLAVMPTAIDPSAKNRVPNVVDDYVLTAVHNLGLYDVIGQDDINSLLSFDKQKQSLGCDDASCFAELGGALGVEKLLVVKIASLGESWALTAKLIQIAGAPRVLARETKITNDVSATTLLGSLDALVKAVFGVKGGDAIGTSARPPEPRAPERAADARPQTTASTETPEAPPPERPRFGVEARLLFGSSKPDDDLTGVSYSETDVAFGALAWVRAFGGVWLGAGLQYGSDSSDVSVTGGTASSSSTYKHLDLLLDARIVFGQMRVAPYLGAELEHGLWDDQSFPLKYGLRAKLGAQFAINRTYAVDASVYGGYLTYKDTDTSGNEIDRGYYTYGLTVSGVMHF